MSKQKADTASDDEFQDALSDVPESAEKTVLKSNEETVEELLNQHLGVLPPKSAEEKAAEEKAAQERVAAAMNDASSRAEYLEEDMDEEELREFEKSMTLEQLHQNKKKAEEMKLEANKIFKDGDAEEAIQIYTEALKICPTTCTEERAILYGNRAAAKIKLESIASAIDDCSEAIKLWPDYVRVRMRRARLYEQRDKLDLALEDYGHVFKLDPSQTECRAAVVRLQPIVNERNEKMKEEMVSKMKDLGNMFLKPFGLSTSNFQMQQDPVTGSYSINFNQKQS